jgi:hypothetical protein
VGEGVEPGLRGGCTRAVVRLAIAVTVAVIAAAQPASAGDVWRALQRPLHLPHLAAGAPCPVSKVDRRVDWKRAHIFGGSGIGPGPVYPGLGGSGGQITGRRNLSFGRWFGDKVFWYVKPSYRGRVLIRGHRLNGPESLRFGDDRPRREMRIVAGETVAWSGQPHGSRGVPSYVYIHRAGCYGAQIDGTNFSRVVVFRASMF